MRTLTEPTTSAARAGAVAPPRAGLSARTWVAALLLTGLCGWWVCQAEILTLACQITESVPAIPGLASLVLLLILNPLLARLPGTYRPSWLRPFGRAELLIIFLFVTVSSSMMGLVVMRFLIALMTARFYFPYIPDEDLTRRVLPY